LRTETSKRAWNEPKTSPGIEVSSNPVSATRRTRSAVEGLANCAPLSGLSKLARTAASTLLGG